MTGLLPCPFCGVAPNPIPQNDDCPIPAHLMRSGGPKYHQTIWCENCGAEGGKRVTDTEAIAAWNRRSPASAWRPIESAPKDGTRILAWTVHENAKYAKDPEAEGYAVCSVIQWIDHNGGGWTWNGLAGVHTHWQPLPEPPSGSGRTT